jgi:hypothetical protein
MVCANIETGSRPAKNATQPADMHTMSSQEARSHSTPSPVFISPLLPVKCQLYKGTL